MYNTKSEQYSTVQAFLNRSINSIVVVVVLLFYVHGKYLMSCRDSQLT